MEIALQLLVNGLIAGAIYALVASGFSLIYSVCRFLHIAHGAVVAFSGYILYFFFSELGLHFALASVLAIISAAFLGWLMNFLVFKPLRKRGGSPINLLMASFAILILVESSILIFFGADVKTIGLIKVGRGIEFLGAIITPLQLFIIGISVALLLLLFLVMKKTKLGKAMRAVADNKDVAEVIGISAEKIYVYAFVLGSVIAGIAGILIGMEQNLQPVMGTNLIIKGMTGSIIGGIGSVPGSIFGAFFLGLAENFGIWFLPSGYKDAIAFGILFAFLIFRPHGILGVKRRRL